MISKTIAGLIQNLEDNQRIIHECFAVIPEEYLWATPAPNINSIGVQVVHICGNLSQYILSGVAGKADVRDRPSEFKVKSWSKQKVLDHMDEIVYQSIIILGQISAEKAAKNITVQCFHKPVIHAAIASISHFAQHVGQIIVITKMHTGENLGLYKHLQLNG